MISIVLIVLSVLVYGPLYSFLHFLQQRILYSTYKIFQSDFLCNYKSLSEQIECVAKFIIPSSEQVKAARLRYKPKVMYAT